MVHVFNKRPDTAESQACGATKRLQDDIGPVDVLTACWVYGWAGGFFYEVSGFWATMVEEVSKPNI